MGLKFLWKLYVLFERITHGRERENFTNVTLISLTHARTQVLEAFKNIMVVMISTGTFDRVSEKSGQDVLTMTWAFVATVSPTLRSEIETMLSMTPTNYNNKEEEEKKKEESTTRTIISGHNEEEEQGSSVVMSL